MCTVSKRFGSCWAAWTWATAPRLAKRAPQACPGRSPPLALWVSTAPSLSSLLAWQQPYGHNDYNMCFAAKASILCLGRLTWFCILSAADGKTFNKRNTCGYNVIHYNIALVPLLPAFVKLITFNFRVSNNDEWHIQKHKEAFSHFYYFC